MTKNRLRSFSILLCAMLLLLSVVNVGNALASSAPAKDPKLAYDWSAKGYAHYQKGDYVEALFEYMIAEALDPDQSTYADWVKKLREYPANVKVPNPGLAVTVGYLGDVYMAKGEREEALAFYDLAVGLDPNNKEYRTKGDNLYDSLYKTNKMPTFTPTGSNEEQIRQLRQRIQTEEQAYNKIDTTTPVGIMRAQAQLRLIQTLKLNLAKLTGGK